MAGTYHLRIDQGSDYALQLVYRDADGEPMPLDGYTAALQIRRRHSSRETLLELSDGEGITLGEDGEIQIEIPAAQTADLPARERGPVGVWDIELTNSTNVNRLLGGKVYVSPEVTRA